MIAGQSLNAFGRETFHAGNHQMRKLRRTGIDMQQSFEVLVWMQRGYAKNVILGHAFIGDDLKRRIHAVIHHGGIDAIESPQVLPGSLRDGNQRGRPLDRDPEKQVPEWQIEPSKVPRKALVLQVVEDRDVGTGAEGGSGETGVEQDIARSGSPGQRGLFP